jgi:hypothetical protein
MAFSFSFFNLGSAFAAPVIFIRAIPKPLMTLAFNHLLDGWIHGCSSLSTTANLALINNRHVV